MTQYAMTIDLRRCIGCQACSVACKAENLLPPTMKWHRVIDATEGTYPETQRRFLPSPCMHCADPPCVPVCPTGASIQRGDGIVLVEPEKCVGCHYCIVACPYEARTLNDITESYYPEAGLTPLDLLVQEKHKLGIVEKCTFCNHRIDSGLEAGLVPGVDWDATPACVIACPTEARFFGDLDDPHSEAIKKIKGRSSFRLLEQLGTKPKVFYLDDTLPNQATMGNHTVLSKRQSSWGWKIATAVFLSGGGGATFLISFLLGLAGFQELARWGTIVGPALVVLCTLFLFLDLGNKVNVFRIFAKPGTSWMSRGAWFMTAFLISGIGYSLASFWLPLNLPRAPLLAIGAVACVFAFLVTLYSGILFAVIRCIPLWNTPALPLLYDFSAFSTGMAVVAMIDVLLRAGSGRFLSMAMPVQIGIILVQLLTLAVYIEIIRQASEVGAQSIRMLLTPAFVVAVIGIGLIIPLGLLAYAETGAQLTAMLIAANLFIMAGNLSLRYFVVKAGAYQELSPFK